MWPHHRVQRRTSRPAQDATPPRRRPPPPSRRTQAQPTRDRSRQSVARVLSSEPLRPFLPVPCDHLGEYGPPPERLGHEKVRKVRREPSGYPTGP